MPRFNVIVWDIVREKAVFEVEAASAEEAEEKAKEIDEDGNLDYCCDEVLHTEYEIREIK